MAAGSADMSAEAAATTEALLRAPRSHSSGPGVGVANGTLPKQGAAGSVPASNVAPIPVDSFCVLLRFLLIPLLRQTFSNCLCYTKYTEA